MAAFLVVPILELVLFIYVERRIGLALMILFIALTAVVGALMVRQQGFSVWNQLQDDLGSGVLPGAALVHGAMVLVGGAFLLTPGFLTDSVGFALMIPIVREGIRRMGIRILRQRTIIIE
ncbi:MAG: FxsA family protein [bacterium]|nr:FxsA family protein [bacterium]MDE0643503.1 FxsA family protein [bacterium]